MQDELSVRGYHGTSVAAAEAIVGDQAFRRSSNSWDWLGHGVYFWEGPARAWQWADSHHPGSAAVVRATLRLGRCIDLADAPAWVEQFQEAYEEVRKGYRAAGKDLPTNRGDARFLDCLIFNFVAKANATDTIRSPFLEGEELFEGSQLRMQQHIQICVRNDACILRPIERIGRITR